MVDKPNPKKSLGQHWLNDRSSLIAMCDAAEVRPGDEVLEIGPGKGSLTSVLLEYQANIFAVEFDPEAVKYLQKVFEQQLGVFVHIEQGDIRSFNMNRMPVGYKIVANIPYYLTSHLVQIISESQNPPDIAVLLVQKEVAERICAKPGDMSLLSLTAQFYWETSLGLKVPATLFDPPPQVDSQILILKRYKNLLFSVDPKPFFRLIKAGFAARRKTLLNSLSGGLRIDKAQTMSLLEHANISSGCRPQELSLEEWNVLYRQAQKLNIL